MTKDREDGKASPSGMRILLEKCGIKFTTRQIQQLWHYHQLLRKHNPELNLTRIHQFENMVLKLYADSILPGLLMELPTPLLDLGTGPGMPGIPLKIAFPEIQIYLAEGRQKRVSFLKEVVESLAIPGLEVIGEGISPAFEKPVNGVITRAVEDISATLARVTGCLQKGGLAVFMKGPACEPEILSAQSRYEHEYALTLSRAYNIPGTPHQRSLIVFRRLACSTGELKALGTKDRSVRVLESEKNETYKELRKLLSARGIKKQGKALVFGGRQIKDVLNGFPEKCVGWIGRLEANPPPVDAPKEMVWYQLAPALFDQIDIFGTDHPILLVQTPPIPQWDPSAGLPGGCTLLVPFQDPENVGAVIRTAVALGASRIILLAECAHPFHPKAMRASGGVVLRAPLMHGPSLRDLPPSLPVVALSARGKDIRIAEFPQAFLMLPGLEGPGLPGEWEESAVAIPMEAGVESLNAATATAIALYAWSLRREGREVQGLSGKECPGELTA